MSQRVVVWFSVRAPVSVCSRSSMVMMSPSSVRLKLIVRGGVKVCCIGPAWVSAAILNVGVISSE